MTRLLPFPDERRPLLFAHRGASSIAPENTMAAFRAARDMGCPGVELDVHRAASGELVVIHDFDLMRLGGVPIRVADTELRDLRRVDIGSWKGSAFKGERISTLDEVFSEFGDAFYYDVEIKCDTAERTGIELQVAGLIDAHGLREKVIVSSFNPFPLKYLKEARKDIPTAIIWSTSGKEIPLPLRLGLGAAVSGCDFLKPSENCFRLPKILWPGAGRGRDVIPWTIDDPARARALLRRGVAGIITNRPQDMGDLV